jgi:hypothetical protein
MKRVLSPVRIHSKYPVPTVIPSNRVEVVSPSRRSYSLKKVDYIASPVRKVIAVAAEPQFVRKISERNLSPVRKVIAVATEPQFVEKISERRLSPVRKTYVSSPVRQYVSSPRREYVEHVPVRVTNMPRARSIANINGLRRCEYVVRDALPTTEVIATTVLVPTETYVPVTYAPVEYVPVNYVDSEPVRRVALSPLRRTYYDYDYVPSTVRRVAASPSVASYRTVDDLAPQSKYLPEIAKLFADIKEPKKQNLDDIGKLFGGLGSN